MKSNSIRKSAQGQASRAPEGADKLSSLVPLIEEAVAFAERWEPTYRAHIFEAALIRLSEQSGTASSVASRRTFPQVRTDGQTSSQPSDTPIIKLAKALEREPDDLTRVVDFEEDGTVHILGRLEGETKRELQRRYTLVMCYIKEKGAGQRNIDLEEIRAMCLEHGCYDSANFSASLRKDVRSGLVRTRNDKSTNSRRVLATKAGLDEAADLLRQLADA